MPINNLFPQGTRSQQNLVEDLIVQSIRQYGREFYYVPRSLVAPDGIFGEDSLSRFQESYMIECYVDNVQEWGGNGGFMSKFGYMIEDQGQLTIAKRRWEQLIGRYGASLIPDRPTEGDLLYFPTAKSLFEIKYVEHQNPFYQVGKLFVYKLKIELFQYSSERITTDIDELNQIALDMTFDVLDQESKEAIPAKRDFFSNHEMKTEAAGILDFSEKNPFGDSNLPSPYTLPFVIDHVIISYTSSDEMQMIDKTRIMSSYLGGAFVGQNSETSVANILNWGGPVFGAGTEYVYIDMQLLRETFPDLSTFDVDLRAVWFDVEAGTSPIVLTADIYTGGTVSKTDNVYSISDAVDHRALPSISKTVTSVTQELINLGERLEILRVNIPAGTAVFV